jgi:hypothetical protein
MIGVERCGMISGSGWFTMEDVNLAGFRGYYLINGYTIARGKVIGINWLCLARRCNRTTASFAKLVAFT